MTGILIFIVVILLLEYVDVKWREALMRNSPKVHPVSYGVSDRPDDTFMYISAQEKATYLKSKKWRLLKERKRREGNYCQVCGATEEDLGEPLELHHNNYERLTCEKLEDVDLVCRKHHQEVHTYFGYSRAQRYPIKRMTSCMKKAKHIPF